MCVHMCVYVVPIGVYVVWLYWCDLLMDNVIKGSSKCTKN